MYVLGTDSLTRGFAAETLSRTTITPLATLADGVGVRIRSAVTINRNSTEARC